MTQRTERDRTDATDSIQQRTTCKYFPVNGGILNRQVGSVKAVDGVSLEIADGDARSRR